MASAGRHRKSSGPLDQDLEILGFPRAVLRVSADAPLADWIVRIGDIAPDGSVTQVAAAGLNGAQRKSSEEPQPLVPGQVYKLEFDLHFLDISQGTPHPPGCQQRALADDMADTSRNDPHTECRRRRSIACGFAGDATTFV